jgi:outer membrane biosynthesis protein TonB
MEQHILSILKESNTIIIPNLGALTITNQTTGDIMFMPYLKYDDGKLSGYIAEQEGISSDEAKAKISNFTEAILNKLATSGIASVSGIGTFIKGDDDIEFKHDSSIDNTQTTENTTPQVSTPEVKEEIVNETPVVEVNEPIKEEHNEQITEPTPDITSEEKTEEIIENNESELNAEEKAPPSKEDQKAALKAQKEEKAKAEKEAKEKAKAEKEAKIKAEKEAKAKARADKKNKDASNEDGNSTKPKKKKGIFFWIIIVVIVILGAGGTYVGLNYEHLKDKLPFMSHEKHEEASEEHEESNDSVESEETSSNESSNDSHEGTSHAKSETGAFYIILGTFSEEVNARGLAERLSMEGVSNAHVIERDGRYSVTYNKYNSKDAALAELETARMKAKNAWIFTAQ